MACHTTENLLYRNGEKTKQNNTAKSHRNEKRSLTRQNACMATLTLLHV